MKIKKEKLLMAVTLILCVLLFLERLTGQIWHAVFGLALIIIVAVHCCRAKGTMKYRKISFKAVDILLIVVLALLVVTGVLAHPLHDVMAVKIIHKLCAVIFVIGIIVHAVQHGKLKKKKRLRFCREESVAGSSLFYVMQQFTPHVNVRRRKRTVTLPASARLLSRPAPSGLSELYPPHVGGSKFKNCIH